MAWIRIRKAFWWKEWEGRCIPTKSRDEEPRCHCSCQTCQADQHHAPGIALPLLVFQRPHPVKLLHTGLQERLLIKTWEIGLSPGERLSQLGTAVESISGLPM